MLPTQEEHLKFTKPRSLNIQNWRAIVVAIADEIGLYCACEKDTGFY